MEKKIFPFVSGQFIQDNRVETLMLLKAKDYIADSTHPSLFVSISVWIPLRPRSSQTDGSELREHRCAAHPLPRPASPPKVKSVLVHGVLWMEASHLRPHK